MSEKIVQLNEEIIKGQIKELVRGSVGLSMMCYTDKKPERTSLGDRQLRGRMGKSLYLRCQRASCRWKSSKE